MIPLTMLRSVQAASAPVGHFVLMTDRSSDAVHLLVKDNGGHRQAVNLQTFERQSFEGHERVIVIGKPVWQVDAGSWSLEGAVHPGQLRLVGDVSSIYCRHKNVSGGVFVWTDGSAMQRAEEQPVQEPIYFSTWQVGIEVDGKLKVLASGPVEKDTGLGVN